MTKNRPQRFRRALGFFLLVVGLLLFYFVLSPAASQGLLVTWVSTWPVASIIGIGALLISELSLKYIVKSWLIAMAIAIPWSTIFFISLPGDYQYLLAALVALAGVLFYRYYTRTQKSKKLSVALEFAIWKRRPRFRKVIGGLLMGVGLLLFYFSIPITLSFTLFYMWLASWPIFFIIIIGCSLFLQMSFRKAVEWLFSAIIITLIPWIAILPNDLKILSVIPLELGIGFYGYYRICKRASNLKKGC